MRSSPSSTPCGGRPFRRARPEAATAGVRPLYCRDLHRQAGATVKSLFRTKPINADHHLCDTGLRRVLGPVDLTLLGIGAIIGAGIFVLTGIAAATHAGPAIIVSYIVAGIACAFSALAYAELAATVGGCGSAYGYAYAGLGELAAWIIGWDLILEYSVATSAVAIGWSGYAQSALAAVGLHLPTLAAQPACGRRTDQPACRRHRPDPRPAARAGRAREQPGQRHHGVHQAGGDRGVRRLRGRPRRARELDAVHALRLGRASWAGPP